MMTPDDVTQSIAQRTEPSTKAAAHACILTVRTAEDFLANLNAERVALCYADWTSTLEREGPMSYCYVAVLTAQSSDKIIRLDKFLRRQRIVGEAEGPNPEAMLGEIVTEFKRRGIEVRPGILSFPNEPI